MEESSVEKSIGRLEGQVGVMIQTMRDSERTYSVYRQGVRDSLTSINLKVDPLVADVADVKKDVGVLSTIVQGYEDRLREWRLAGRIGRWVARGAWVVVAVAVLSLSDHLWPPLAAIVRFFER